MANLKVNTDAVAAAAGNIKLYNMQIRDGFPDVQTAMTQLDNCWDGAAASMAIGKFNELRSKYLTARYNALDNYVNFLIQQISEGYTQTESVNISLADQFK